MLTDAIPRTPRFANRQRDAIVEGPSRASFYPVYGGLFEIHYEGMPLDTLYLRGVRGHGRDGVVGRRSRGAAANGSRVRRSDRTTVDQILKEKPIMDPIDVMRLFVHVVDAS